MVGQIPMIGYLSIAGTTALQCEEAEFKSDRDCLILCSVLFGFAAVVNCVSATISGQGLWPFGVFFVAGLVYCLLSLRSAIKNLSIVREELKK